MAFTFRSGTELINPFKLLERVGVREGDRVADLGCGALGHFVFPAAQLVGGTGTVYAVDIQKDVLQQIEKGAKDQQFWNITPVWSDIEVFRATHIDDGTLDLTLLVNNLFLAQNREQLVREMARLTRPGGRIVIVEWKPTRSPIGPPPDKRMSKEEAMRALKSSYMDFHDEFDAGEFHYGLMYSRNDQEVGMS